jgi:hypothetical protein
VEKSHGKRSQSPPASHPRRNTLTTRQSRVAKLERKEILEKTESGYSFQVPLVQNYVEQVVEEEE